MEKKTINEFMIEYVIQKNLSNLEEIDLNKALDTESNPIISTPEEINNNFIHNICNTQNQNNTICLSLTNNQLNQLIETSNQFNIPRTQLIAKHSFR
jgi:hypothetical protein